MTTHGRPSFAPLFLEPFDLPNPDVRDMARGKAGVYILRQRGIVRYVGSSVPEEKGGAREPLRLWKTVLRHFQKCKGAASNRYGFGDDNFCTHDRNEWEIAIFDTHASDARKIEQDLIEHYTPTDQPKHTSNKRKARKPKNAGGRRKRNPPNPRAAYFIHEPSGSVLCETCNRRKKVHDVSDDAVQVWEYGSTGWTEQLPPCRMCGTPTDVVVDKPKGRAKRQRNAPKNPRAELAGDTGTIDDEQKILHHASVAKNVPGYLFDVRTMRELAQRGLLTERPPFSDFSVFVITKEGREAFAKGTR